MSADPAVVADDEPATTPESILVVGTGLVGTSVALAARGSGAQVWLVDRDEATARVAAQLGAGTVGHPDQDPDLVVVGVPPAAVGVVVADLQRRHPTSVVTDLASVKAVPRRDVGAAGGDLTRYVGGHPLAGRERSGPRAARGDLFEGRPWVLTPSAETAPEALALARGLVLMCGALPVRMEPQEHDSAVALVSHVPHLVAAATAARLAGAPERSVALSGQGIRDVTRIAASDPDLWVEILTANAAPVAEVLGALRADLDSVIGALGADPGPDRSVLRDLLSTANLGHAAIPGKHGGRSTRYIDVPVIVPDEPGALARLFTAVGEAEVNIEDFSIEHSPGQPVGLIDLFVRPGAAAGLITALRAGGWTVQD